MGKRQCQKYVMLIPQLIDGELDRATAAKVEHHLRNCKGCMNEFRWYQWLHATLRSMPYTPAPPDFTERTLERIRQLKAHQKGAARGVNIGHLGSMLLKQPYAVAYTMALIVVAILGLASIKTRTPTDVVERYTTVAVHENIEAQKRISIQPLSYASAKGNAIETSATNTVKGNVQLTQRANKQKALVVPKQPEAIASQPALINPSPTRITSVARTDVSIRSVTRDFGRDIESSFRIVVPSTMLVSVRGTTVINSADAYLVRIGHLISVGKLSEAAEHLREFAKVNEIDPALRYRALSMLKSCYERMGEWLMAKAVFEQMLSELSHYKDIKSAEQIAERENDMQVKVHTVLEDDTYPEKQTRLASLPPYAQPTATSNALAMQSNAVKAFASNDSSSQLRQTISMLEEIPQDEPTERLLNEDQTFIDALFKLSEAI